MLYSLPPLPGPNINARFYPPPTQRVPQVDGPSVSSGEEDSPPLSGALAPRTVHPLLPQPPHLNNLNLRLWI
jgi:transcription initiation factor TFIIA large subunit